MTNNSIFFLIIYSARVNSQVLKIGLGGGRLARQDMVSGRDAQCCVFNAYMERGGKRERDAASTAPDHLYISGAVESAADAGALAAHSKYLLNLRILCCFQR